MQTAPRTGPALPVRHLLPIALLGLILGGLYFASIDLRDPAASFGVHQRIIDDEAGSPYRYRVLVPIILEALTYPLSALEPREVAFLHASSVYDCVGLIAQLLALYLLLREWFSARQALIGVAFTAAVTIATFAYFTYQPWSITEVTFFCLGFLFAYRGRRTPLVAMVVLASLNRETGIFLPLALLLANLDTRDLRAAIGRSAVREAVGLVALSTAVFGGLRLLRGSADPVDRLGDVISRNLLPDNLTAAAMVLTLFLGLAWIYAVLGLRGAPSFVRGLARVVPLYLAAFALWGWWREVRILTTLYPIAIPLVLSYCYRRGRCRSSCEQVR
jgi:hypothetical protein